jgi:hypothetical protein
MNAYDIYRHERAPTDRQLLLFCSVIYKSPRLDWFYDKFSLISEVSDAGSVTVLAGEALLQGTLF